jgi:hypothetical protein
MSDTLPESWPKHWTGSTMGMSGLVRVDGTAYRWCGPTPAQLPAATQSACEVDWTDTTYTFDAGGVRLRVTFASAAEPSVDPLASSRPVSTLTFAAASADGKDHAVQVYADVSGEWCTHTPDQRVAWSRHRLGGMPAVSMGTVEQPVLARAGDWTRIDWGRVFLAAPAFEGASGDVFVGAHERSRGHFAATGRLAESDETRAPRAANDDWPVLAGMVDLGTVGGTVKTGHLLLAYDDGFAIELFERKLRPFWAHPRGSIGTELTKARDRLASGERPDSAAWTRKATKVGGESYARLLVLTFRQVMAGHKIAADWDGTPLAFSKENTSNGCIATVDVIYPACPFFLVHNPEMLKAQLRPILMYASSPRWTFPFAPHDLGTYPKANGQVYGGGETGEENQMPVEESGNMLLMLAGLAKVENNADFCKPWLPTLAKWAEYLEQNGLDPANQLCTDDFAGHLARNANLSAKTVVALGGYAQILAALGDTAASERWMSKARVFAAAWRDLAKDGDATLLAFGSPETWSQKYNLVWDRVLGLGLFPQEVFEREMTLYRTKMQPFGLPLDSRKTYTKADWTAWTACLTGRRSDFDAIMTPMYGWVSQTPSRVPVSDWYETTDGKTMGMHTRTVIGGLWMPMLLEKVGAGLKD